MKTSVSVLFVCLGNICRSPMAEFLFLDLIQKEHLSDRVNVASAATSGWEIANPPHQGTRDILSAMGISCKGKRAVRLEKEDYDRYDFIIGMDEKNIEDMMHLFEEDPANKVRMLLSFCGENRDVKDPWYTQRFDVTRDDIQKGLQGLLAEVKTRL